MPTNQASGISCQIVTSQKPSLPFEEYKHTSVVAATPGLVEETVFIESTAGTTFEVKLNIPPESYARLHPGPVEPGQQHPECDYLIKLTLDGVKVKTKHHFRTEHPKLRIKHALWADGQMKRKFQFGELSLVDADDDALDSEAGGTLKEVLCRDENVIKHLGSIQVQITRCKFGEKLPWPTGSSIGWRRSSNQMKFSERCKKVAFSNTAGLSEESFPYTKELYDVRALWKDPAPFLKFVFQYRNRALLEAQNIVAPQPLAPSPSPPAAQLGLSAETLPESETTTTDIKRAPGKSEQIDGTDEKPKVKAEQKSHNSTDANASASGSGNQTADQKRSTEETGTSTISPKIELQAQDLTQEMKPNPGHVTVQSQTVKEEKPELKVDDRNRSTGFGRSVAGNQHEGQTAQIKKRDRSLVHSTSPKKNMDTIILSDDTDDDHDYVKQDKKKKSKVIDLTEDCD